MELRHVSYVVGMSLSACLCTGCMLFPTKDPSPVELQKRALEERIAIGRGSGLGDDARIPPFQPPPPPPSDYLPHPIPPAGSLTASVEPDGKRIQFANAPKAPAEETPVVAPVPESPLVAAFRCEFQKHPEEAQKLLDTYDKSVRDRIMCLMKLTTSIGEKDVPKLSPTELASTLEQLDKLTADLRQRAGLTIDRVCFCRKIDGFGQFEKLPDAHEFQPGSEGRPGDRIHLYVELRNFGSRLNDDGMHETTLSSSLRIVDLHDKELVALNLGPCVDRCKSRRQDYYHNVQFHVPSKLPVGVYYLHVDMEDQTPGSTGDRAKRRATLSLPFRVGAAGIVTAKP